MAKFREKLVYVVGQCYRYLNFFSFVFVMVMYDNECATKEN